MIVYTIGFTKKSAQAFFTCIQEHNIQTLIDIRLNNTSQLAGFSKGNDIAYFLQVICGCNYQYEAIFAPTKELMQDYQSKSISTQQFEARYTQLINSRDALRYFIQHYANAGSICLLCSEDTPDHCHRRVLAELLAGALPDISIQHL